MSSNFGLESSLNCVHWRFVFCKQCCRNIKNLSMKWRVRLISFWDAVSILLFHGISCGSFSVWFRFVNALYFLLVSKGILLFCCPVYQNENGTLPKSQGEDSRSLKLSDEVRYPISISNFTSTSNVWFSNIYFQDIEDLLAVNISVLGNESWQTTHCDGGLGKFVVTPFSEDDDLFVSSFVRKSSLSLSSPYTIYFFLSKSMLSLNIANSLC